MVLRTATLGRNSLISGVGNLLYQVDAGNTWILKCLVVSGVSGGPGTVTVHADDGAGGHKVILLTQSLSAGQTVVWTAWFVATDIDQVTVDTTGTLQCAAWASGTKLVGLA